MSERHCCDVIRRCDHCAFHRTQYDGQLDYLCIKTPEPTLIGGDIRLVAEECPDYEQFTKHTNDCPDRIKRNGFFCR